VIILFLWFLTSPYVPSPIRLRRENLETGLASLSRLTCLLSPWYDIELSVTIKHDEINIKQQKTLNNWDVGEFSYIWIWEDFIELGKYLKSSLSFCKTEGSIGCLTSQHFFCKKRRRYFGCHSAYVFYDLPTSLCFKWNPQEQITSTTGIA